MLSFALQYYFPGPRSLWSKKKIIKAGDVLGCFSADTDLALDWWFLVDVYFHEYYDDIPKPLRILHLVFTILGTVTWICLATDGRAVNWFVVQPLLALNCIWSTLFWGKCREGGAWNTLGGCWQEAKDNNPFSLNDLHLSTGFLLLCGILLEDVPQIILSFLIQSWLAVADEDGSGDRGEVKGLMVANLLTSVYNSLIKLADAYDQRKDLVVVTSSDHRFEVEKEFSKVEKKISNTKRDFSESINSVLPAAPAVFSSKV